jgi:hypothetical protein
VTVFYFLTGALNERIIAELRNFWAYHPKYPDLIDNIQGKYTFSARPQRGMVVKTSGGSNVRLTWDNFQGNRESYVSRGKIGSFPGVSIEWVREDGRAIQENDGVFPSPPGVYVVTIIQSDLDADGIPTGSHQFQVEPYLEVLDEAMTKMDASTWFLANPYVEGTLHLYELPSNVQLVEGVNYTSDSETGEVILTEPLPDGLYLSADYKYLGEISGPFDIHQDRAHYRAIPGAVLAFGRRITPNDKIAVVVRDIREVVALEYGGRWNLSVDIEMWARDVEDQREMADLMMTWVPTVMRSHLSTHGVEIESVSFGGETEEIYDENGDDYFYGANLSLEVQTDWHIRVPLVSKIRRVIPLTLVQAQAFAGLSDEEIAEKETNIKMVENLSLQSFQDPFFTNLFRRFEVIR